MRTHILRGLIVTTLGASFATLGCSPSVGPSQSGDIGTVGFALDAAPGVTLSSISYSITGPATRSGSVDTSHSATLSFVVGGLPAGSGYAIALSGTATDGSTQCGGSASFAVAAHQTTAVAVHVTCHQAAQTGSVLVNGVLNVCPAIDGLSATPAEVLVGGTIALSATAHDADGGPSPLAYHWSATSGTLSDASAPSPTLTCTTGGPVTVTLAVSDGDCGDTFSTTVTCTGVAHVVINEVESNGDPVGDWVELTNAGTATADISGWKLLDNDDTHPFVVVPAGTTLAPGGFFAIYVFQTFGLGAPDSARLYNPSGTLIDSYSWTTHAAGTYGRCPDGTGPFVDSPPSRGAPNNCGGGGTGGAGGSTTGAGGGAAGAGGSAAGAGGSAAGAGGGTTGAGGSAAGAGGGTTGAGGGAAGAGGSTAGAGGGAAGAGGGAAGAGGGAAGTGGASGNPIVINEVESNGDAVGDWVELTNIGPATVDISGYKLLDNDDTHPFVVVPAGTTLAPGGFFAIYVFQTFGLGAPDSARLYNPAGTLIDSYSWTTHAAGTYGRCPDGTGPFVDSPPSRGAPNNCGGGAGGAGGGAAGAGGGTAGAGGGAAGAGGGTAGAGGGAAGAGGGTAGAGGGAAGAGGGTAGAGGGAAGTVAASGPIVINEVESNGDPVGDWVELTNIGSTTIDISGYKLLDNDNTHAFVVVPTGTTLAPGGFFAIYVFQTFGLGAPDMARLFDPSGTLIDSYSWTTHAMGTYGRCPDGTGPFVDSAPSRDAPNNCGGGGTGGAGGAGSGGGTGGLAGNEFPWPGTDTVITVDDVGEWASNLSGLSYQPATATDPAVLWAIDNGPSKLYRLLWNGTTWESDPLNSWGMGKTIHYPTGVGDPDSEGVSKAEWTDSAIYVSTERDNDNNTVNRFSVLRYDTTASGTDLTATNEWDVTADLPAMGINLGLEAITYIPDTALVAGGFIDQSTNAAYDPSRYPNHSTGLFFVGLESNGTIYAYALNHADNTFTRVATFASGQVSIMDLSYDREVGYLWAQCDNTCDVKATVFRLDTSPTSPTFGTFQIGRVFDRPDSLPDSNFEGIGIAPEAECAAGQKHFFWSDDSALDGHSLRRGSIPCGAFF